MQERQGIASPGSRTRRGGLGWQTNERFFAWCRTGLTALVLAFAVGRVAPDVAKSSRWPYEIAGVAFGILGAVCLYFGYVRVRAVEEALDRGSFAVLQMRCALGLVIAGVAITTFMTTIIVANP